MPRFATTSDAQDWATFISEVSAALDRIGDAVELPHPQHDAVPTGDVLVHRLQVVDFKRLKSQTHSIDRSGALRVSRSSRSVIPGHLRVPNHLEANVSGFQLVKSDRQRIV